MLGELLGFILVIAICSAPAGVVWILNKKRK